MGFFENIYGDKPERTRSEKMYDYAFDVMNDVDLQYAAMTPGWQRMVRSGEPCDTVPGGKGEFGHDLGNPIPVNGPIGEFSYLSRLRMKSTGSRVYFHRVANHDGIDEFELTNVSGQFADHLFLDPRHPAPSALYPDTYYLERDALQPRGITTTCPDFPQGLYKLIKKEAKQWLKIDVAEKEAQHIQVERAQKSIEAWKKDHQ